MNRTMNLVHVTPVHVNIITVHVFMASNDIRYSMHNTMKKLKAVYYIESAG